jgi:hypothetical protein
MEIKRIRTLKSREFAHSVSFIGTQGRPLQLTQGSPGSLVEEMIARPCSP